MIVLQKEPCVEISPYFTSRLRPHQTEGIRFIWNNLIESTDRAKDSVGGGCILAHCMGLGKTLQTIVATHTMLKCKHLNFTRVLVVAPMNTVRNWIEEFVYWCEDGDEVILYNFAEAKTNKERVKVLKSWKTDGGALIIGYDMYRIITTKTTYHSYRKVVTETLIDPGPDIVVCDEGHMLKNSETHLSKQLNKIKSKRRLVLTGTPLQNNLLEYHCMVNFVKPGLLGSLKEFRNRFVNPITNGQHIDSTDKDVKIMKKRSHVLHEMLSGFVQRKDYDCLKPYLHSKYEYVIKVRLTPLQIKLYQHYLDTMTNRGANGSLVNNYGKGASLFCDYQNLMRVWTHPKCLLMHTERREKMLLLKQENDFMTDDESETGSDEWEDSNVGKSTDKGLSEKEDLVKESVPILLTDTSDTDEEELAKRRERKHKQKTSAIVVTSDSEASKKNAENPSSTSSESSDEEAEKIPHRRSRRKNSSKRIRYRLRCPEGEDDSSEEEPIDNNVSQPKEEEWYDKILQEDTQSTEGYQNSLKIVILFEILRMAEDKKEKVLVFSQSLISLNLIEEMLRYAPAPNTDVDRESSDSEKPSRWYKNVDYFRMDGSTQGQYRQRWINAFNDENDTRSRLFLISTKAGGLGVNLVGANRVVIFDACWNPSHDTQSMFRVYRFGQSRICYIYRLIAEGTMEEKIYQRQVNKQSLAFRVVDEHQINRHFTASSLAELYKFQPTVLDPSKPDSLPVVPKDEILAEILSDPTTRHLIASYHEHDSLLDHQHDQELTEEERKSAWEEYEAAKVGRNLQDPGFNGQSFNHQATLATGIDSSSLYVGTSGSFNFPATQLPINFNDIRLAGLYKIMMRAYALLQKCVVHPVDTLFKQLKLSPLYKFSDDASVMAIAVEINSRQKLQRKEKYEQYQRLRMEFVKLQTGLAFAAVGSGIKAGASPLLGSIYGRSGQQLPSTSTNFSALRENPVAQTQSSTFITEVIDITDDVKE